MLEFVIVGIVYLNCFGDGTRYISKRDDGNATKTVRCLLDYDSYMVSIQLKKSFEEYEHLCTGSLISEIWILTSASCCQIIGKHKTNIDFQVCISKETYYGNDLAIITFRSGEKV